MATLAGEMLTRLQTDPVLTDETPGQLGFRIFNRWLSKTGPGKTSDAYDDERGGRLRRVIVVVDGGENDEVGRQPEGTKRLFSVPTTHIFAEPHEGGKQAALDAYRRIEQRLLGWDVVLGPNERLGFVSGSRIVLEDSELYPGNVEVIARWRFSGTRRLVPA